MKTRTLLLSVLLVVMPVCSSGQIGGMLKKGASKVMQSVGKAVNKEANREADSIAQQKADQMVKEAADNARENQEESQADDQENSRPARQGGGFGAKLFSNEVTVKHSQEYSFNSRMYMQTELYNEDNQPIKMDYNIFFSKNSPDAGIEMKTVAEAEGETMPMTTQIIVDGANKCFLMITELTGMKIGIISAVPDDSTLKSMDAGSGTKPPKVTRTGNTKVIIGYKCDEYIYQEEGKKELTKMWMTKDAVINIDKNAWSKAGMPPAYGYAGFEGMVNLAWESYDDKGKLVAKSEVKQIDQNYPHKISVAGTSFRQVDFGKMAAQQSKKK